MHWGNAPLPRSNLAPFPYGAAAISAQATSRPTTTRTARYATLWPPWTRLCTKLRDGRRSGPVVDRLAAMWRPGDSDVIIRRAVDSSREGDEIRGA
jgi:hypothetical protein